MASVVGPSPSYDRWKHAFPTLGLVETGPKADRSLTSLIEREIIPRLVLAHDNPAITAPVIDTAPAIDPAEVDTFAPLALRADAAALLARVEQLLARGITAEQIMVHLLAPVARRLGTWWEEDECDFVEVTMGLWRLQEVVRELTAQVPPIAFGAHDQRRALFAAMPGDQHGFGAICIGETFRLNGWDAEIVVGAGIAELLDLVGGRHFDIVGLTLSCDGHSERLPSAILALRSVSRNPRLRVMVGGRIFIEDSALAVKVGADGTAPDALAALDVAEGLIDALDYRAAACG